MTRGEVHFNGQDLAPLPRFERVRLAIAHVLEGRRVFERLTADENLIAATSMHRDRRRIAALKDMVYGYFPRLKERQSAKAGYLSGGEQQMPAIGRALMTEPKLLLLDEPSSASRLIWSTRSSPSSQQLNGDGVGILLVEQNATARSTSSRLPISSRTAAW